MALNNNIFCASNPARILDALWEIIGRGGYDFSDCLIFLPSRRAVRSVEKMIVKNIGAATLLPTLVPLGTGPDDMDEDETAPDVITNQERVILFAKLLTADPNVRTFAAALPIARDLVRMQDYLENEGVDAAKINWLDMVDEKYAEHFRRKAEVLNLISHVLPSDGKTTQSKKRNEDIRLWRSKLADYGRVIVCGSTASVPATADLMAHIATLENGYIILPGKVDGRAVDLSLDTNPYNAEYKFLARLGMSPADTKIIDVGASDIDFFNHAFGNSGDACPQKCRAHQIVCARESEEAAAVAEIASRAIAQNKTVLVITPDAAGNQRIAGELARRNIMADFSGGVSAATAPAGRAVLNMLDDLLESGAVSLDADHNLFDEIMKLMDANPEILLPEFQIDSPESSVVWDTIANVSDFLARNGINLNLADARAVIADALSGASIRAPMKDDAPVCVLGTIESRMQTADIVILTGLNEGMFPATGYENPWLPRHISEKIGLPPPERKVSLMALDFINLSCAERVYWLRSAAAGASQTTESRFISRAAVASGGLSSDTANDILAAVRRRDAAAGDPLDYSPPRVAADRTDVYVTELELLIHNPYAFYARHILRLRPRDDYWQEPDARAFGNLVHSVVEIAAGWDAEKILDELDRRAKELLPPGSIQFHFWHKRFVEFAPAIAAALKSGDNAATEIRGSVKIAGRNVFAKADRIWDGVVMDIKTGSAPSAKQLEQGNMPQLPLEAYIMQSGGFPIKMSDKSRTPVLQFLQLKNNNVKLIEYPSDIAQKMIDASVQKISELFGRYSKDYEPYEYRETGDKKYKVYDDLARVDD